MLYLQIRISGNRTLIITNTKSLLFIFPQKSKSRSFSDPRQEQFKIRKTERGSNTRKPMYLSTFRHKKVLHEREENRKNQRKKRVFFSKK